MARISALTQLQFHNHGLAIGARDGFASGVELDNSYQSSIHTHARTHARAHAHTHTHTHTHLQTYIHTYIHTHTHTHVDRQPASNFLLFCVNQMVWVTVLLVLPHISGSKGFQKKTVGTRGCTMY